MVNSFYPRTLEEALKILSENHATPYAGGSDIMTGNQCSGPFVFIGSIPELKQIYEHEGKVHIGACATFNEGLASPFLPGLLRKAASVTSSPAVRNVGTFGGNLANGAGKADSVVADFALDAVLKICSSTETRYVPVEKFYFGRKTVDLKPEELITEIIVPAKDYGKNLFFEKVATRNSLAISNVTIASVWEHDGNRLVSLAIAVGAAGDTVMRNRDLERELAGKTFAEVQDVRMAMISEYRSRMQFPLDRTAINYRTQVCSNLIGHILSICSGAEDYTAF